MAQFLWVCFGGACGTGARYLLADLALRLFGARWPVGTLVINVAGSFLIGAVMEVSAASTAIAPALRVVLITGFLGGFTTYSAFSWETVKLVRDGAPLLALSYAAATTGLCLLGCWAGGGIGRALAN